MELIGSGLYNRVHDRAVAAAKLRAIGIGLDFELTDGIDRGLHHVGCAIEHVAQIRVVVDTVEQKVILQRAGAIGAEPISGFDARSWFGCGDAGTKKCKLSIIASV